VVRFTPLLLYSRYPLDRGLGEPQSQSGRCGELLLIIMAIKTCSVGYKDLSRQIIMNWIPIGKTMKKDKEKVGMEEYRWQ
jgi:hypothetical protein